MMRLPIVSIAALASVLAATPQDPAGQLAAARASMGGEALLASVQSLTVTGTWMRQIGPAATISNIELHYQAPDKFVRVETREMGAGGPMSFRISTRDGFNGDASIHEVISDAPFPIEIAGPVTAMTAEELKAAADRQIFAHKHAFTQLMLPLFAASQPAYPLTFTSTGSAPIDGRPADIIEVKGIDDFVFKLHLDGASHRPVLLTWMAKPLVTFSTTSTMTVRSGGAGGGQPPVVTRPGAMPPPGDPTANLTPVEYRASLSNYKATDGLSWPTRFTIAAEGKTVEEWRLNKFKINPKIDAKLFNVPQRRSD